MSNAFKIYDASAGSGKTYILTKEYLKIILATDNSSNFRQILAITFTNKAVNEMKQRILGSLYTFSQVALIDTAPALFLEIMNDLEVGHVLLKERSKIMLKEILHNYSFFDVATIDKFTHRLIRTFARDLQLSQNFEVVLDTNALLGQAVDGLLDKAGSTDELTKVLVDFALEKIDGDKSWDIAYDLNVVGKLLFEEDQRPHLKRLETKSLEDFLRLKRTLQQKIAILENQLTADASRALTLIRKNRLVFTDFIRASFPKFLQNIVAGEFDLDFNSEWKKNFETTILYTKSCPPATKAILDRLHPEFSVIFLSIKATFYKVQFLRNSYRNIVPLSVLNAIQKEVSHLEKEKDLVPISSFNSIIANEIKDQPVPFIFERLGEKYRHYFIDEFQDTSEMQWNNLIPLIGNALDSLDENGNTGSLLLVGDAKQAIYRWRGGKAEQFLKLAKNENSSFVMPPNTNRLPKNYRSHEEIIKFNNAFFSSVSQFLNDTTYRELFLEGNQQAYNTLKGGVVSIQFTPKDELQHEDDLYAEAVVNRIRQVVKKGYHLKDICILVRKNKHGVLLAKQLMQEGIPIISSETLLLSSYAKVKFLINLLRYSDNPKDLETSFELLLYLSSVAPLRHTLIEKHLKTLPDFLRNQYQFDIDFFTKATVYDGLEYAIRQFRLADESDAYLTFLMDEVLNVEQRFGVNAPLFLEYWDQNQGKLSIVAPENVDAVQIMTVHKSKGLEFPIVIFPYANTHIYEESDPKLWLPVEASQFHGFDEVLVSKKQEVMHYGQVAEGMYQEDHCKLELDAFNILYVALTRAVRGLYIISKMDFAKEEPRLDYYSGLFIHFLKEKGLWDTAKTDYHFGELEELKQYKTLEKVQHKVDFLYSQKENPNFRILTTSGALWGTERAAALHEGNLIHRILGFLKTAEDVDTILQKLYRNGELVEEQIKILRSRVLKVIQHPALKRYFAEDATILLEREIITENGVILRPDRVVIQGNVATVIDYKTGKKRTKHHQQVRSYENALQQMGYARTQGVIVYMNETVTPEFI
ncbi:UvrD-helicase domain-containing protein [Arenibacter sp. GZD96]|uniref:UvrD-helicase domain-containing protein n=1 Tax=Aurantibrevibacter litoralis TaxID=3106030 RepID=UPI002B002C74|nr:UvrD-helicase domain-containing protein [Arenibacter sp. GZD-96]MEA1785656.1 UvrD-helicase domain-containing protein [Arenibacter sp. GZD-96]